MSASTASLSSSQSTGSGRIQLGLVFVLALGLAYLVFRGGWSLGFFLAILLIEAVFLAWTLLPLKAAEQLPDTGRRLYSASRQVFLAAIIVDLGLCMFLYASLPMKLLNTLVLLVLLPVQILMANRAINHDWDRPTFWAEAIASCVMRPFIALNAFWHVFRSYFSHSMPGDAKPASGRRTSGKIIIGLLMAIPFLLICGALLSASDQVFAQMTQQFLANLSINELIIQLVIALVLTPFIFSFLYSTRSRQQIYKPLIPASEQVNLLLRIDKIILITFLSCINLLYIVFAIVQFGYLLGAFQAALPAGMSYADYARSGFFELAGISLINLALVVLTVKSAERHGAAGFALRIESLLLILGSLVQGASAIFRMKMYIDTYGLTLLRFWVTAFILFLFVVFILLIIKEFSRMFPLFKISVAALLVSLLVLNHVNADAWIANHNVALYESSGQIDTNLYKELSNDAVPAMMNLVQSDDPEVESKIARQLLLRYETITERLDEKWQLLNVSDSRAKALIETQLPRLQIISQKYYIVP